MNVNALDALRTLRARVNELEAENAKLGAQDVGLMICAQALDAKLRPCH